MAGRPKGAIEDRRLKAVTIYLTAAEWQRLTRYVQETPGMQRGALLHGLVESWLDQHIPAESEARA